MTEQTYARLFFTRYWKVWVIFLIVGLLAGYGIASQMKPKHEGAVTFSVSRTQDVSQSDAPFYVYDGYYSEQAAVILRNNFAAWLTSPKTAYDIYSQAGTDVTRITAEDLGKLFTVNENPEVSTVNVTFGGKERTEVEKIGSALVSYAEKTYPTISDRVDLHTSTPLVVEVDPPRLLVTVASALALAFISFFVTLLMHYFKNDQS